MVSDASGGLGGGNGDRSGVFWSGRIGCWSGIAYGQVGGLAGTKDAYKGEAESSVPDGPEAEHEEARTVVRRQLFCRWSCRWSY